MQNVLTALGVKELIHVLSAMAAFSVICLGTLQAIFVAIQEHLLRYNYAGTVIKKLPPLERMETILFQLIWLGFILLSLVLISSLFFFYPVFSPFLLEKTLLASFAWMIYAILLLGRYFVGWRGRKIIYYTLCGFALLVIVYFCQ